MFFLPLPLNKTLETLDQVQPTSNVKTALPNPEYASSTMLEKASVDDIQGFQAFTIRNLDNKLSTDSDTVSQIAQCQGRPHRQSSTIS